MSERQYDKGYANGRFRGVTDQIHADRVAAFGAIRRAASWARYADAEAARPFPINPPQNEHEERLRLLPAHAIRKAIRAAIGSPKA